MESAWFCRVAVTVCLAGFGLLADRSDALEFAPLHYPVTTTPESFVPYVTSQAIDGEDEAITRVIVSIHSSGFDALQYYDNARAAAQKQGVLDETLIVAPQLFERTAVPGSIPEGLLFWRVSPFRGSSRAAVGPEVQPLSLSAFAVLDTLLDEITNAETFPNLQHIVLVGHSGGGQLVQRYAMVGKFKPPAGIQIRYVVSAPSSYAYPSSERYHRGEKRFLVPDGTVLEQCPGYDSWGYGLSQPYAYFKTESAATIASEYAKKSVFYLCGSRDNDPDDGSIGKNCGAMMQGLHRLQRMQVFHKFLTFKYGRDISKHHRFAVVPNVGHYGRGTMTSRVGLVALFSPLASD